VGSSPLTGGVTIGVTGSSFTSIIKAIEEITDVTVLANPKILAVNKQLGQVYIGTKVGYLSATTQTDTSTTQQVSFLDTGTKLSFRPYIGNDGYIRMDIHPKDSSANIRQLGGTNSTTAVPDETSAELISNIIVKDGETIVIGGLFREKTQTVKKQVPVLGNLPVVGNAFSSKADDGQREEVIVLLTPHIIETPNQSEGLERSNDVARKSVGAKKELHMTNSMKMAQEHYERATSYYIEKKNDKALKELKIALELYPSYLEAIQLEEKIYDETNPSKKPVRKYLDETEQPQASKWRRR
jgi:type II secretory pathway component GspD/PulD (secretin)